MVATCASVVTGAFMGLVAFAIGTGVVMGLVAVAIGTAAVAQDAGYGCTYGRVLYTCAVTTGFFFLRQNGIAPEQHSNKMQQGRSVSKNVAHHGQPSVVVTVVMLRLGLGLGLEEVTSVHKWHKGRTDAANRMVFLCVRQGCWEHIQLPAVRFQLNCRGRCHIICDVVMVTMILHSFRERQRTLLDQCCLLRSPTQRCTHVLGKPGLLGHTCGRISVINNCFVVRSSPHLTLPGKVNTDQLRNGYFRLNYRSSASSYYRECLC